MNQKRKIRAFTLIELLVVITIIGVLVSIAMPGTSAVLENMKKVEVSHVLSQFQNALNMYQTDYSTWPEFLTNQVDADGNIEVGAVNHTEGDLKELYLVLSTNEAYSVNSVTNNRRGTSYLQFTKSAYFAKGMAPSGKYTPGGNRGDFLTIIDPWHRAYSFVLDGDYDSLIKVPDVSQTMEGGDTVEISASVAAWSTGKNGNNPKKYITTWK